MQIVADNYRILLREMFGLPGNDSVVCWFGDATEFVELRG